MSNLSPLPLYDPASALYYRVLTILRLYTLFKTIWTTRWMWHGEPLLHGVERVGDKERSRIC